MATKTQTYGTTNSAVTYAYDAQGQLQSVTYPSGKVIAYQYSNGLVSGLLLDGQPLLSNIGYEPFGAVKTWRFGTTGNTVTRSYDLDGQLTSYTLANGVRNLSYASTGNITALIDPNQAANDQSYAYDALYRLNQTTGLGSTETYQYDANGNRTLRTVNGVEFGYGNEASSNRLLSVAGPQALTNAYDAVGNIINDGANAFTYNAANRLVAVSASQSQYTHNGLGQRVFKSAQGLGALPGDANDDGTVTVADFNLVTDMLLGSAAQTPTADCTGDALVSVHDLVCINSKLGQGRPTVVNQTLFVYDEQGQLIGEYTDTGAPMLETVWLGNIPVAVIKSGNVYSVYADHLNTPRAITNSAGTVVWEWKSDAFGTTAANDDPDGDGKAFVYNLRFPGQYFDAETGLNYNYFRDYNPQTGRYVQSDPIGLGGGVNTYAYVDGDPISFADPSGLCPVCGLVQRAYAMYRAIHAATNASRPAGGPMPPVLPLPNYPGTQIPIDVPIDVPYPAPYYNESDDDQADDAQAPGCPTEKDGFIPKKNWDGKKVKAPKGRGYGYPDKKGNIWVPTGPGPSAHGGPHWDVQRPGGGYINVYPGGKTRPGRD